MANFNKRVSDTAVRIACRFSYPHVFEPRPDDPTTGAPGKYDCQLMIDKTDADTMSLINGAIEAAKKDGISRLWGGKLPKKFTSCLKDGDMEEDPSFEGHWLLNPKSSKDRKPGVAVLDGGRLRDAMPNTDDFYAGCRGYAVINFYAYNHATGGPGVSCALNNVIKTQDDEHFGAPAHSIEDDFGDLASELESAGGLLD